MLYNSHSTHMHNTTTSMDARHIYMTYTHKQKSDMNAILFKFNTHAQANNKYGCTPYTYDIHTSKQVI